MKPHYLQPQQATRDRWVISYMDVLTILLIFFVAIAAHSLPAAPKPPAPEPERALVQTQRKLEPQGLDLRLEPRGLVISLPQTILFSSGDDRISREAFPVVEQIAAVLRDIPNHVTLIGHADAIPIHNRQFKNNWELSAARGLRLLELLSDSGIPESRLSVASDGPYRPKSPNDTPDGRASNRRVEIVILDETRAPGSYD